MKFALIYLCFVFNVACSFANGFIQNIGQFTDQFGHPNTNVLFVARTGNMQIQLRKNGYSYEYIQTNSAPELSNDKTKLFKTSPTKINVDRIDIDFINANSEVIVASQQQQGVYHYYKDGNAYSAKEFEKVVYLSIYPNIDIEFLLAPSSNQLFKYNIILHPGANVNDAKFLITGAQTKLQNGCIVFSTEHVNLSEKIPLCYKLTNNQVIKNFEFNLRQNQVSFSGPLNISETLVIDPVSNLLWGCYQGASGTDVAMAIDLDAQNNLYITGYTNSSSNLASSGAFQSTIGGSLDIYLAKFNAQGQRIWTTYLGGPDVDLAYVIAVQPDGTTYISGGTSSTVSLVTANVHQTVYGGGINDIFIAAFDANGQRQWCTYYGGSAHDIAQAIACDKSGNVLVSGHTESTNNIASAGAYKTVYNFNYDVCLAKFSATGQRIWGTYYGDSGIDETYAMCTDAQRNVYITGGTTSITDIATASAHQQFNGGSNDAFIAKFDSTGVNLIWGSFYGGLMNDFGTAIECDGTRVFLGGNTGSANNIASPGAQQSTPGSTDDTFIAAFTVSGNRLWATYHGGEDSDYINDFELDNKSQVLIAGSTISTLNIGTVGAYQPSLATIGVYDAYLARYSPSGTKQLCTYYGGEGNDQARGVALDQLGRVYLVGESTSTAGIATAGAFQTLNGGGVDAFVAKFCIPYTPKITPSNSITACSGSIVISALQGYSAYVWSNAATTSSISVTHTIPGTYKYAVSVFDGVDCNAQSDTTYLKIVTCVGTQELESHFNAAIFPNPVSQQLTVVLDEGNFNVEKIQVLNLQGELLLQQQTSHSIDVSDLPAGLYFVRLSNANTSYTLRFIKQ